MGSNGLEIAQEKMRKHGLSDTAVEVFSHHYRLLEHGETGMISESSIEPIELDEMADLTVSDEQARAAMATTAVIKLNGGLGTSMGLDRAKSLLCVRRGMNFLDVIARQILALRKAYDVELPLILMNSFRTSADTMEALERYEDLPVEGLPLEFLQNQVPKLLAKDLMPVSWPVDPELEWCPPGHGDLYTVLGASGVLDQLIEAGYERVFVSNSDNLGATPDPKIAGWMAQTGAPFGIEAVRRTAEDVKGGHFARRKVDGRIVLRETAQTPPEDLKELANLDIHQYANTNNIWIALKPLKQLLTIREGVLGLPLIRNEKTVDPTDKDSPKVIQAESAMGAAIEIFEGAEAIVVPRDRFVPVKSTNQLLVLRSDVFELDDTYTVRRLADEVPYVELDPDHFKLMQDFDQRFPQGAPSLQKADSLRVEGDWTFGSKVTVIGDATLEDRGKTQYLDDGTVLQDG